MWLPSVQFRAKIVMFYSQRLVSGFYIDGAQPHAESEPLCDP
jgi:hypothetical protein